MLDLLNDKLNVFKKHVTGVALTNTALNSNGKTTLPNDLLKLGQVISNSYEADQIEPTTVRLLDHTPLLQETSMNPVYTLSNNEVEIWGSAPYEYTYIKKPDIASWGYVVVNKKAMYDPNNTTDFELHPLEETELVYKILTLAGITLKRPDLSSTGAAIQQAKIQQEKI